MTPDSEKLRELIRTTVNCHCSFEQRENEHSGNRSCQWYQIVATIYRLERAHDAANLPS